MTRFGVTSQSLILDAFKVRGTFFVHTLLVKAQFHKTLHKFGSKLTVECSHTAFYDYVQKYFWKIV